MNDFSIDKWRAQGRTRTREGVPCHLALDSDTGATVLIVADACEGCSGTGRVIVDTDHPLTLDPLPGSHVHRCKRCDGEGVAR